MSLPPAAIPALGGSGPLSFLECVALHVCVIRFALSTCSFLSLGVF